MLYRVSSAWTALADPHRRAMLELLRERGKPLPASDPAGEPEPIREPLTVKLRAV